MQIEDIEPSPPLEHENPTETTAAEIDKDRDYMLDKVNDYLEDLLRKDNRNIKLQRHMAMHYYTRNMIYRLRARKLKKGLEKPLKSWRKGKASWIFWLMLLWFLRHITQGGSKRNFRKFWWFWEILNFLKFLAILVYKSAAHGRCAFSQRLQTMKILYCWKSHWLILHN